MKFRAALIGFVILTGPSSPLGGHAQSPPAEKPRVAKSAEYPQPPEWNPDALEREKLRRSLTLLNSSTPTDRKTIRVLFYGQSITQQAWWKEVEKYLRTTYPNANLIVQNRAIGGHSSQLLVKTAEADLYPFQPDLLIFHVYGSHTDYEKIIRNVRERTCADILLQTDHVTKDAALTEESNPAKLSPKDWDAWINNAFLPDIARRYEACRADVHQLWKSYLQAHKLKAADLLKDGVHLNAHGEWLMAEWVKRYLAPLRGKAGYDPMNEERVRTMPIGRSDDPDVARIAFKGRRADLVFKPGATGEVEVLIDGKRPSEIAGLYGFTRVSAFPQSDWPVLLKVGSAAQLVVEEWTMRIDEASPDGKVCVFRVSGSVTGADGAGVSTNRFVSNSGRVVIEPEDWNVAYAAKVFQRSLPAGYDVKWKVVLHGQDRVAAPDATTGAENAVTVASGLPAAEHTLELRGRNLQELISAVRIYAPGMGKNYD
ncbi:MAG: hypothetical protein ACXW3Z_01820 [Limisphaerales bacterium]